MRYDSNIAIYMSITRADRCTSSRANEHFAMPKSTVDSLSKLHILFPSAAWVSFTHRIGRGQKADANAKPHSSSKIHTPESSKNERFGQQRLDSEYSSNVTQSHISPPTPATHLFQASPYARSRSLTHRLVSNSALVRRFSYNSFRSSTSLPFPKPCMLGRTG